jgi:hypothetical protein
VTAAIGVPLGWLPAPDAAVALVAVHLGMWDGFGLLVLGAAMVPVVLLVARGLARVRLAAWLGRLPRRVGALPTEVRPSSERPRGYKVARLVAGQPGEGGAFLGATLGGTYSRDGTAGCEVLAGQLPPPRRWGRRRLPPNHAAPDLSCTCGFHAMRDRGEAAALLTSRPPISRLFGLVLLEVDLGGTVVEFDRGFRASHQRVLGVQVPRWCLTCATAGRARRAVRVAGLAGGCLEEACKQDLPTHPPLYRLAMLVHHREMLARLDGRAALRAVCEDHTWAPHGAVPGAAPAVVLELADLAAQLGTEVSWLDDDGFDVATFVETMALVPPGRALTR